MDLRLILEFAKRDFTEQYAGSVMGMAWAFVLPLVQVFIYIVIFAEIMGAKLPGISNTYGYGIYLVCGILVWTTFSNIISRMTTIFIEKKHLITKVNIALPTFGFFLLISETVKFIVIFLIFIIFLVFSGHPINYNLLYLPFIFVIQQIFAYSLGFLFAILTVFIKDIQELVKVLLQFWFWFTPIVYTISILPVKVQELLDYNPIYIIIKQYHEVIVYSNVPNFKEMIIMTLMSHLLFYISFVLFKKLEKDIRDFI